MSTGDAIEVASVCVVCLIVGFVMGWVLKEDSRNDPYERRSGYDRRKNGTCIQREE